ncbi:MAG: PIG-L family deacetylase [Acidobacteria bacterium]|nr:PIG-L family deacetylase [Acidobacteriota bacterium]
MSDKPPKTILVISPHPDDLEIGMGGTVAYEISLGTKIVSVVLTDGRRSQRSFKCSDNEMAEIRNKEVKIAANLLKIQELHCLNLSDLYSPENQEKLYEKLSHLLIKYQPNDLYMPHPKLDRHYSHVLASELVLAIIKRLREENQLTSLSLWAYEIWGLFPSWDLAVDISKFVDKKRDAINCHQSQVQDIAYAEGVLGLNRWRAVFSDPHKIPAASYLEVFVSL